MNRRFIAMAAGFAVLALAGAQPASADQCTAACDKNFSTCNGSSPDTAKCLPAWGQCKRACSGKATTPTPAAKVTKAADVKAKPAPAKTDKKKGGK